ncbi:DUF2809 domain-containing protein [Vibrio agarivorans]|nr:DUF2809 domain-containing protein [Vibrio agarivorans]
MINDKTQGQLQNNKRNASVECYFRFSMNNLIKSCAILVSMVVIALYVRDSFIRPTFGDVLVVMWLYYLIASVIHMPAKWLSILVISLAFFIEFAQLIQVIAWFDIAPSSPVAIIFGATFDWKDLLAYCVGGFICWWLERK